MRFSDKPTDHTGSFGKKKYESEEPNKDYTAKTPIYHYDSDTQQPRKPVSELECKINKQYPFASETAPLQRDAMDNLLTAALYDGTDPDQIEDELTERIAEYMEKRAEPAVRAPLHSNGRLEGPGMSAETQCDRGRVPSVDPAAKPEADLGRRGARPTRATVKNANLKTP